MAEILIGTMVLMAVLFIIAAIGYGFIRLMYWLREKALANLEKAAARGDPFAIDALHAIRGLYEGIELAYTWDREADRVYWLARAAAREAIRECIYNRRC